MRILVTGASGFLGSALAISLQSVGHEVFLLLRPTSSLERFQAHLKNQLFIGRADSEKAIVEFVKSFDPEVVVHTACCYGRNNETALDIVDVNVRLGLLILETALASRTSRHKQPLVFVNTNTVLAHEMNLYALTKHQFSQIGEQLGTSMPEALKFIDVKLQHMYGPGDDGSKFTTFVIDSLLSGVPELRLTAGEQRRDFIFIDDVVEAYTIIINTAARVAEFDLLKPGFTSIQVGSGHACAIKDFVRLVHRLVRSSTKLYFGAIPYRLNEAMFLEADLEQMTALNWKPRTSMELGILKTVAAKGLT